MSLSDVHDALRDNATAADAELLRLTGLPGAQEDVELTGVAHDSRQVRAGNLFAALPGAAYDGHDAAADAVRAGAAALLVQRELDLPVPQLRVRRVRAVLGVVAALVHGEPGRSLALAAVTGTNGKTTTSLLLQSALVAGGRPAGLIGTLGARFGRQAGSLAVSKVLAPARPAVGPAALTTPEAPQLQALLAELVRAGAAVAVVEASSIALDQGRLDGLHFEVAVHLGLEEEHLDYHGTIEHYYASKAALFDPARSSAGVVRVDDAWGRRLAHQLRVAGRLPVVTFGTNRDADVRIDRVSAGVDGLTVRLSGADGSVQLEVPLVGRVNAVNATAAYLAARHLGVDRAAAVAGLAAAPPLRGRHTLVPGGGAADKPLVIVDYAHTPDALSALVDTGRDLAGPGGRVSVVFGGREGRDRYKRPALSSAAAAADRLLLTSHDAATDGMSAVLAEYQLGLPSPGAPGPDGTPTSLSVEVEPDRRRAIARAIGSSGPGDVVLIAGRGHETGPVSAPGRSDGPRLDDSALAAQALAQLDPAGCDDDQFDRDDADVVLGTRTA